MLNYLLAGLLAAIQVFDIWSTRKILSSGGQELNPTMRWLMQKFGMLPSLVFTKVAFCAMIGTALYILREHPVLSVVLAAANVFYINFVVIGNSRWLIQHSKKS